MKNNSRKRYRYITCGVLSEDDKVSDFRLIAGNNIKPSYHNYTAVRVVIPEDMELCKYSSDAYSTTDDNRKIKELGYDIMLWDNHVKRWHIRNEFKGMNPCDIPTTMY